MNLFDVNIFNIIQVTGLMPTTSTDTINNYFCNVRRSGGGRVISVQHDPGAGNAIVSFEDMQGQNYHTY